MGIKSEISEIIITNYVACLLINMSICFIKFTFKMRTSMLKHLDDWQFVEQSDRPFIYFV